MTVRGQLPVWHGIARVSICDEMTAARGTVAALVAKALPKAIVDCADGPGELLVGFADAPADIVLVAARSRGSSAVDTTRMLRSQYPAARVVVYGSKQDCGALSAAIAAGACGIMLVDSDMAMSVPPAVIPRHVSERAPILGGPAAIMTERELQILRGMTDGYSNLEIARRLFVSEDTVKTHARRLFRKLGANDRAHAVALGMRHELVA